MKKVISIVLSLVMLLSVSVASVSAFAAETVGSQETVTKPGIGKIIGQVNGNDSKSVTHKTDKDNDRKITFKYNGDGNVTGWEFQDMKEGVDYKVVSMSDDKSEITILVSDDYSGDVIANAIVDFETTTKRAGNQNKGSTSPKTGAAAAAGIAAMGAGVAILTALKKKED